MRQIPRGKGIFPHAPLPPPPPQGNIAVVPLKPRDVDLEWVILIKNYENNRPPSLGKMVPPSCPCLQ